MVAAVWKLVPVGTNEYWSLEVRVSPYMYNLVLPAVHHRAWDQPWLLIHLLTSHAGLWKPSEAQRELWGNTVHPCPVARIKPWLYADRYTGSVEWRLVLTMPGPAVLPDEQWPTWLCWQTELHPLHPAHNNTHKQELGATVEGREELGRSGWEASCFSAKQM